MALHALCVSRASSSREEAAPRTPTTLWGAMGLPLLSTSSANECLALASETQPQRARQPGGRPGDGGRKRVSTGRKTGLRRPENGSSITETHRAVCPSTPGNFGGFPEVVAGDGSSPAGIGSHRRPEIGSSIPGIYRATGFPHFFSRMKMPCPAPQHPWQAHGHHATWPHQDQVGGTPLKSNKCH